MNCARFLLGLTRVVSVVMLLGLAAGTSFAASFNLRAAATTVEMPDGTIVPMWGFGLGNDPVSIPGPPLVVPEGDTTLIVHLTNDNLPEPVSIMIPGQPALGLPVRMADGRIRSFTLETAPNMTMTYTWTGLKPGTYLYQSATHAAVQVQMGLYGALKVGQYEGITPDKEVTLIYSEVDTALHQAVSEGTYGTPPFTSTIDYAPDYFLINGQPYPLAEALANHPITTGEEVLIRFLNAGLKTHVPTLTDGYLKIVAEDGNLLPYPLEQYSVFLPAGKTLDALWAPSVAKSYPLFDKTHHLTNAGAGDGGMLVYLSVNQNLTPLARADFVSIEKNTPVFIPVLANDYDPDNPRGVMGMDAGTSIDAGSIAIVVPPDGGGSVRVQDNGVIYTPAPHLQGVERFTYTVRDKTGATSNAAVVTVSGLRFSIMQNILQWIQNRRAEDSQ